MSTKTQNLQLTKPDNQDFVDINILNENYDIIDAFAGSASTDYPDITNKPQINSTELVGNKSSVELGLADAIHQHTVEDIADLPKIPTKVSDLTNDSNYVADENYVHTDSNFTTEEKSKLESIETNANNYTLPPATAATLGGVKVDGVTTTVSLDGTLRAVGGSGTKGVDHMTLAEYEALPESKMTDSILRIIDDVFFMPTYPTYERSKF